MNKILLVYEDYTELMTLETAFKKVGFDVIGLSNEYLVGDQIVGFNPDLVVVSGKGGKVNSLGVGKKLKEMPRWQGKTVLIFTSKPQPQDLLKIRVDMVLEAPVPAQRLLQVVAKLLEKDESLLSERFGRAVSESEEEATRMSPPSTSPDDAFLVQGSIESKSEKGHFKFGDRMSVSDRTEVKDASSEMFDSVDMTALENELLGKKESAPLFDLSRERESKEDQIGSVLTDGANEELRPPVSTLDFSVDDASQEQGINNSSTSDFDPKSKSIDGSSVIGKNSDLKLVKDALEVGEDSNKALSDLKKANEVLKKKSQRYQKVAQETALKGGKGTVSRVASKKAQKVLAAEWNFEELESQDKMRQAFTKAMFKK